MGWLLLAGSGFSLYLHVTPESQQSVGGLESPVRASHGAAQKGTEHAAACVSIRHHMWMQMAGVGRNRNVAEPQNVVLLRQRILTWHLATRAAGLGGGTGPETCSAADTRTVMLRFEHPWQASCTRQQAAPSKTTQTACSLNMLSTAGL